MSQSFCETDASFLVWQDRYCYRKDGKILDTDIQATWRRVAQAAASVEANSKQWTQWFMEILQDFKFLPGGRILAGAGAGNQVTLFNCFVMGEINDDAESIRRNLEESALTLRYGGGIGCDFSHLRPANAASRQIRARGPIDYMHQWKQMCQKETCSGLRRGAMMGTLRCDHPDIEAFIAAKQFAGALRHFNLSVLVTDEFMQAVEEGRDIDLVIRQGTKSIRYGSTSTRRIWDRILLNAYEHGDPGILFIDHINREKNLRYCEEISATNPCGEIPLPSHGACDLGSINLTQFVRKPFTDCAAFDFHGIAATAAIGVRLLDNIIDISQYPLPQQSVTAKSTRRIGLGITGLADALIMLGVRYGSPQSPELASKIMRIICYTAYRVSTEIAADKGSFPLFDVGEYIESPFIRSLPEDIRKEIAATGIRNSHLLAIAPTGSISLLANNVSSGIEPMYWLHYRRKLMTRTGIQDIHLEDYAYRCWRQLNPDAILPDYFFVDTFNVRADAHLEMQAHLQRYVDNSISKTINVAQDYSFEDFQQLYTRAYELGLKGCTVFRSNAITGSVLSDCGDARYTEPEIRRMTA